MNLKKILYPILLISWMVVIFLFSNQDGPTSQSASDQVAFKIIDTITVITKQSITETEKNNLVENTRILIRKTAHFTLYFILGILVFCTLSSYSVSHILMYGILFCFLYACTDEIHQIFLDGRAAKIFDILIDTSGAIVSNLLCYFFTKYF